MEYIMKDIGTKNDMAGKYKLEKNPNLSGYWVLTDTENLIVCKFKEHEFNETQQITVLEESKLMNGINIAGELNKIVSEMGRYMFSHWYSIALPTPIFEFREDEENDQLLLIRNKFPKFTLRLQSGCDLRQLSNALKAASEFVEKLDKR